MVPIFPAYLGQVFLYIIKSCKLLSERERHLLFKKGSRPLQDRLPNYHLLLVLLHFLKFVLTNPHTGQTQSSGKSSNAVPGTTSLSGSRLQDHIRNYRLCKPLFQSYPSIIVVDASIIAECKYLGKMHK